MEFFVELVVAFFFLVLILGINIVYATALSLAPRDLDIRLQSVAVAKRSIQLDNDCNQKQSTIDFQRARIDKLQGIECDLGYKIAALQDTICRLKSAPRHSQPAPVRQHFLPGCRSCTEYAGRIDRLKRDNISLTNAINQCNTEIAGYYRHFKMSKEALDERERNALLANFFTRNPELLNPVRFIPVVVSNQEPLKLALRNGNAFQAPLPAPFQPPSTQQQPKNPAPSTRNQQAQAPSTPPNPPAPSPPKVLGTAQPVSSTGVSNPTPAPAPTPANPAANLPETQQPPAPARQLQSSSTSLPKAPPDIPPFGINAAAFLGKAARTPAPSPSKALGSQKDLPGFDPSTIKIRAAKPLETSSSKAPGTTSTFPPSRTTPSNHAPPKVPAGPLKFTSNGKAPTHAVGFMQRLFNPSSFLSHSGNPELTITIRCRDASPVICKVRKTDSVKKLMDLYAKGNKQCDTKSFVLKYGQRDLNTIGRKITDIKGLRDNNGHISMGAVMMEEEEEEEDDDDDDDDEVEEL